MKNANRKISIREINLLFTFLGENYIPGIQERYIHVFYFLRNIKLQEEIGKL